MGNLKAIFEARLTEGTAFLGEVLKLDDKLGADAIVGRLAKDATLDVTVNSSLGEEGLGRKNSLEGSSGGTVLGGHSFLGKGVAQEGSRRRSNESLGVHCGGCGS